MPEIGNLRKGAEGSWEIYLGPIPGRGWTTFGEAYPAGDDRSVWYSQLAVYLNQAGITDVSGTGETGGPAEWRFHKDPAAGGSGGIYEDISIHETDWTTGGAWSGTPLKSGMSYSELTVEAQRLARTGVITSAPITPDLQKWQRILGITQQSLLLRNQFGDPIIGWDPKRPGVQQEVLDPTLVGNVLKQIAQYQGLSPDQPVTYMMPDGGQVVVIGNDTFEYPPGVTGRWTVEPLTDTSGRATNLLGVMDPSGDFRLEDIGSEVARRHTLLATRTPGSQISPMAMDDMEDETGYRLPSAPETRFDPSSVIRDVVPGYHAVETKAGNYELVKAEGTAAVKAGATMMLPDGRVAIKLDSNRFEIVTPSGTNPDWLTDRWGQPYLRQADGKVTAVPIPTIDDQINLALVQGNPDLAVSLSDFRDRPSAQERFQAAMEYARAPGDLMAISAIVRGLVDVPSPADGQIQRVAPPPPWVVDAWNQLQASWGIPEVMRGAAPGIEAGEVDPGSIAGDLTDLNWNNLSEAQENSRIGNETLGAEVEKGEKNGALGSITDQTNRVVKGMGEWQMETAISDAKDTAASWDRYRQNLADIEQQYGPLPADQVFAEEPAGFMTPGDFPIPGDFTSAMPKKAADSIASSTAALDGVAATTPATPTAPTVTTTATGGRFSYSKDHEARGGSHDITGFQAARIGDDVWWVKQETFRHFEQMQNVVGQEEAIAYLKGLGEKLSQSQYDALKEDAINGRWVAGDDLLAGYKGTISDVEKANKDLKAKQAAWVKAAAPIWLEMLQSDSAVKLAYESLTARLEQQGLVKNSRAWFNQITTFISGQLAEKNVLPPGMGANGQFTADLATLTIDSIAAGGSDMLTQYIEGVEVAKETAVGLDRYKANMELLGLSPTDIEQLQAEDISRRTEAAAGEARYQANMAFLGLEQVSGIHEPRGTAADLAFNQAMEEIALDPLATMEDMEAVEAARGFEPTPAVSSYVDDDDLAEERWEATQAAQPPAAVSFSDRDDLTEEWSRATQAAQPSAAFDDLDLAEERWEATQAAQAQQLAFFEESMVEEEAGFAPEPEDYAPGVGGWEEEDYAKGGTTFRNTMALVGEEGPELVHLPAGTKVIPADFTEAMLQGRKAKRMAEGGMVEGATFRNVGPSTGILYGQEYPRDYPAGVRQLLSGRAIEQPESLFRPAGLRVPSAQAIRRLIPEEVEAYKELGQLAGIPQKAFEREFREAVPGGIRPRQARMQPRRMRRL